MMIEDINEYDCPDLLELFEENYPRSARNELKKHRTEKLYYGRNVIWIGEKGRMIQVDSEYAQHIEGNIFEACKLAAIVEAIKELPHRITFYPGYCEVSVVEPIDIKESIEYEYENGLERPLTTGSDELDEYITDPEQFDEEEREELEEELQYAIEHDEGDLGSLVIQIRDGNHRAFGALLAGEPYIYLLVSDNQMKHLKENPTDPRNKRILEALE